MFAPRILWTMWFGMDMSKSTVHGPRILQFHHIIDHVDVIHRHLNLDNIYKINVSDHPIHPQIMLPYLSGIHKADYMRSYVMYHYGGAYADIKPTTITTWKPFFDDFKNTTWIYGAREGARGGVACNPTKLQRLGIPQSCNDIEADTKDDYQWRIFKSHTPFARSGCRK